MAGRRELKIGDEVKSLEWLPGEAPDQGRVRIGETEYAVRFQTVDEHWVQLEVNGRAVQAFVAGGANRKDVFIQGGVYRVEELDQARKRKSRAGLEETPGEVTPPMPAVVVRILVQEGDAVVKGQGLVVVSAMKMETTLKAPFNGLVKKINTALQAKVMPGDRLLEIEEGKQGQ
jgi:acetyl/propionyl-CoA carboxylase alpha subunit